MMWQTQCLLARMFQQRIIDFISKQLNQPFAGTIIQTASHLKSEDQTCHLSMADKCCQMFYNSTVGPTSDMTSPRRGMCQMHTLILRDVLKHRIETLIVNFGFIDIIRLQLLEEFINVLTDISSTGNVCHHDDVHSMYEMH